MFDEKKSTALSLRRAGKSITEIGRVLGIPISTLSGWFKNVKLTDKQLIKLRKSKLDALVVARLKASLYHRAKKRQRMVAAEENAKLSLSNLDLEDKNILKLALATFFIGEGFKAAEETSLGNSDPKSVKSFIRLIQIIYGFNKDKLRIYLHLRSDQDVIKELQFWSSNLEIGSEYFKIAPVDKRTIGKPTYENYHGVCAVRYYDVSIKRELLAMANIFFDRINSLEL